MHPRGSALAASLAVFAVAIPGCTSNPQPSSQPSASGPAVIPDNTPTSAACAAVNRKPKQVVALSNGGGRQQASVRVHQGDVFAVNVNNSDFDVSEPTVTVHAGVLCRVSVSAAGHDRRAVFLARQPGSAYIAASITGVPGGINHPSYGVRVTVK